MRRTRRREAVRVARAELEERLAGAVGSGDRHRAVELVEELVRLDPDDLRSRLRLARARLRTGRGEEFETELDHCIDLLGDGRRVSDGAVRGALWTVHLSPQAHRLHPRLDRLERAIERADGAGSSNTDIAVARARVLLAQGRREDFVTACDMLPDRAGNAPRLIQTTADRLRRVGRRWGDPRYPDHTAPKVFGIGLSRTGTTSLHEALRILGLDSLHWMNDLTMDLIRPADLPLHDAFCDTSVTAFFEPLLHMFPSAKFIWTTRPADDWVASVSDHYRRRTGAAAPSDLLNPPIASTFRGLKGMIEASVYAHHRDWETALQAHERRIATSFAANGPDRLLRLPLVEGAGWKPLCEFLDLPVPSVPFPHSNRRPDHGDGTENGPPDTASGPAAGAG